jgi:hypothetical protein
MSKKIALVISRATGYASIFTTALNKAGYEAIGESASILATHGWEPVENCSLVILDDDGAIHELFGLADLVRWRNEPATIVVLAKPERSGKTLGHLREKGIHIILYKDDQVEQLAKIILREVSGTSVGVRYPDPPPRPDDRWA